MAPHVQVLGECNSEHKSILSSEALQFFGVLQEKFGQRRLDLLNARKVAQARFDAGAKPDFLVETRGIREGDWKVAPLPADLLDRRVEITGPVDRKMVINALNSGASVFMADFEDSNAPTWSNQLDGLVNMGLASRRAISFKDPKSGKSYKLNDKASPRILRLPVLVEKLCIKILGDTPGDSCSCCLQTATLMVRPRGWHLPEKHILVNGRPTSGSIFDFAFFFFHNAKALTERGSGPYFYLPKMESHLEARLWNDIFCEAQDMLNIPRGTIKATCLIETLPAAFEMDEILFELREHSAGLNCGRWDYIFSFIKTLKQDPQARQS
eukprot:jgi/Astpho2/6845/Aster-06519